MISIVIPTREEERSIEKTIRQFESLSIPHEVIVSDGKSADRTVGIARATGARVVVNESGVRSPSKQRNDGAHVAEGEFILFIDATVIMPDIQMYLTKALKHFEDPKVVALAVPQWIYPESATRTDRIMLTITNWMLKVQKMGSGKFVLTRRSAFEKLGGYREDLMTREDGDFFIRSKTIGTVVFDTDLPIYYAGRREHAWGWPKLLYVWVRDTISVILFDKSASEDWAPVR
ncbi:MAG: aglE 2 [Candidatus Kaiserbacteria bacterium]|nr:aglE 2 [Candidatus Kaiserbacteria bacterium]